MGNLGKPFERQAVVTSESAADCRFGTRRTSCGARWSLKPSNAWYAASLRLIYMPTTAISPGGSEPGFAGNVTLTECTVRIARCGRPKSQNHRFWRPRRSIRTRSGSLQYDMRLNTERDIEYWVRKGFRPVAAVMRSAPKGTTYADFQRYLAFARRIARKPERGSEYWLRRIHRRWEKRVDSIQNLE